MLSWHEIQNRTPNKYDDLKEVAKDLVDVLDIIADAKQSWCLGEKYWEIMVTLRHSYQVYLISVENKEINMIRDYTGTFLEDYLASMAYDLDLIEVEFNSIQEEDFKNSEFYQECSVYFLGE